MENNLIIIDNIKDKIYTLRSMQVMLDKDLADLYGVKAIRLREQVKRNKNRFPTDFMFQLTASEVKLMVSQNVLTNDKAIEVNIQIMRAFVAMRRFLIANAQVFQRLDKIELKQIQHDAKFEEVFNAIQSQDIVPKKGIFFDGQIFEAYKFASDLVRIAKQSIVLIDNYIDDSVLTLLSKRNKKVNVIIFTKEITKSLLLDLEKYNLQYPKIEVKEFALAHDRFLIIDDKDVYHFGASLKDLGKKWFAFSKFDKEALNLLERLSLK